MPDLFEQIEMPGFSPAYDPKTKYGYTNPRDSPTRRSSEANFLLILNI